MAGGGGAQILQVMLLGPFLSRIGNRKMSFISARIKDKDLVVLKDLLETGKVVPVIDRRYPLRGAAEAFRYLGEGHAQGKIVITIAESSHTSQAADDRS
jgi:NADPH:quinone reductase-like Zn-dependent oxidoreductase